MASTTRKRSNTVMTDKSMDAKMYTRRGVLGVKDELEEFFQSAYNPQTQELWGRDAIAWGKLVAFYLCFYAGLVIFYCVLWFLWTRVILNRDSPEYSGPDEGLAFTPGLSHFPILDPEKKSTLIRFSRSNDTQVAEIKDYMYNELLSGYEPDQWSSENGNFIDCTQGRTDDDIEKVCIFKLDWLRPCILEDDYGWADGQPCIILKLNRINNWEPEDYASIEEVPDEIKDVWRQGYITVKCFGADPLSKDTLNEIEYYPYQGWKFDYFPFTGQQGYKSPLVAVQFMSLPHRALVFITCKAYTKNMIYESSYRLGMTQFEIIGD